jgi:hypothetical protein
MLGSSRWEPGSVTLGIVREVKLVLAPPGFPLRLRTQFRAMRPVFVGLFAAGFVLPSLLLFVLVLTDSHELWELERGELFASAATANVGLFLAFGLFNTFARAIPPSPLERSLPRAVTFRVDGLRIEPRDAEAYEISWDWIRNAFETASGLDLKIGDAPLQILHVAPSAMGDVPFEQLVIWLQRHGKLAR